MLPEPVFTQYPEFVPDQLLTNDNLNDLFGYLDQQGRLTRINLIGIGIVCGLEVKVAKDGSSITITKGCGVTSEGYLVEIAETTFQHYKKYDALKEHLYSKFAAGNPAQQLFPIDELTVNADDEGAVAVDKEYLKEKVVLLFVELLQKDAKNCDPDSCDDKGVNVTVTIRPLVVGMRENIQGLQAGANGINGSMGGKTNSLPVIPLPRFDVPATNLATTANIIDAYRKLLQKNYLTSIEQAVAELFKVFKPFLKDIYTKSGYEEFAGNFAFLQKNANLDNLILIQYYYDFVSDVLAAYDELRKKGMELMVECCPDTSLFPRHLLLGPATGNFGAIQSDYRHYFIPSPAIRCTSTIVGELRTLFVRLILLNQNFSIPESLPNNDPRKVPLRITPSSLGRFTLSQKAIPYYYSVLKNNYDLIKIWNYQLSKTNNEFRNLSYYASSYPVQHDEISDPLRFDIEPYNFFRIEGIIGKDFRLVVRAIQSEINDNRLPFDVVALRTGSFTTIPSNFVVPAGYECHFDDLAISYEIARREWEAIIGKTIEYLNLHKAAASKLIEPKLLAVYLKRLYESKKYMYTDIALYIKARVVFMEIYDYLEVTAQSIRTSIYNGSGEGRDTRFAEDLIDHFDAVVLNSEKGGLRTIYEQYDRKVAEIYKKLFLSNFLKSHPGIQHKAGVPSGGTFIIVYHQNPVKAPTLSTTNNFIGAVEFVADKPEVLTHETDKTLEPKAKRTSNKAKAELQIEKAAQPEEKAIITNTVLNTDKEHTISYEDNILFSQLKRNLTPAQWEVIERYIPSRGTLTASDLEALTSELADGTVIADFYLPYSCSGDCNCINFIIADVPPAQEKLTISIDGKQFCSGDKESYSINISPTSGEVTGGGVSKNSDGNFSFSPSAVDVPVATPSKQVVLTYTKDGQSVNTEVTVFLQPSAVFTITNGTSAPNVKIFKVTTNLTGSTLLWDLGDGTTSTLPEVQNQYSKAGTYTIKLTVNNGVCPDTTTQTFTIKDQQPTKDCGKLDQFITAFNGLSDLDKESFETFKKNYASYADVESFFKELTSIAKKSTADQSTFLGSDSTCSKLADWLRQLNAMIKKGGQVMLLAIALFRILTSIAMYAMCLQPNQNAEEANNLLALFKTISELVKGWSKETSTQIKQQISIFIDAVKAAIKQTTDNGEATAKKDFIAMLNAIVETLSAYL